MATAPETEAAMRQAGFGEVHTQNRGAWYATISAQEVEAIEGPLKADIIKVSDQATYDTWLAGRRSLRDVVKSGGLCPTHLRGVRPDS